METESAIVVALTREKVIDAGGHVTPSSVDVFRPSLSRFGDGLTAAPFEKDGTNDPVKLVEKLSEKKGHVFGAERINLECWAIFLNSHREESVVCYCKVDITLRRKSHAITSQQLNVSDSHQLGSNK